MKGEVTQLNDTFRLSSVELFRNEAVDESLRKTVTRGVRHAGRLQEKDLREETAQDEIVSFITVNLRDAK